MLRQMHDIYLDCKILLIKKILSPRCYIDFVYIFQAPSGYTAEQWAAAQQQNWTQWQQWQQQYQQWQAQYGEKVCKI